jgi:hypothetical protein
MDGTGSIHLLAGFILVVLLHLPFLLPCYLPHIVAVGLNLKTTGTEAEHYFYSNKEKEERRTSLDC